MRRAFCLIACLLSLLLCTPALAQEDLFAWTLRLGGDGVTTPRAMALASDGGVFIAGDTDSEGEGFGEGFGQRDGFVLRLDEQGLVQWRVRYGGSGDDLFTHVLETAEGGCIVMGTSDSQDGHTRSPRGGKDAFLVCISAKGETLWTKNLGGTQDDELLDIIETEEGQFVVCGRTKSRNGDLRANNGGWDAWVALLAGQDGRQIWVDRYGDQGDDMYTKIIPYHDGWLLLGEYGQAVTVAEGETAAFEGRPIVMLYSLVGQTLWSEPVSLAGSGESSLVAAHETSTGWLLLGQTSSRSALLPTALGSMDLWVSHLRYAGTVQWQRRYGGSLDDTSYSVVATPEGGYIALGTTESSDGNVTGAHGESDIWVVALSSSGQLEWQQSLGGSEESTPAGLVRTAGGGYIVAGTSRSQDGDVGLHVSVRTGVLFMLSSNGNLLEVRQVGGGDECTLLDLQADVDSAYVMGVIRVLRDGVFVEDLLVARLSDIYYPPGE